MNYYPYQVNIAINYFFKPYKTYTYTVILEGDYWKPNILKINQNKFVYSDKDVIQFWNSDKFTQTEKIDNLDLFYNINKMFLLKDDLLCLGGDEAKFNIIVIKYHKLISKITVDSNIDRIHSINICFDGTILCSFQYKYKNIIIKYRFKKGNFVKIFEKEDPHGDKLPLFFIELSSGIYASGGEDNLIRLWKF